MKVPSVKFGAFRLTDMLIIGGSKVIGEKIFVGFAGNGTVKSALYKGAAAAALTYGFKGRYGNLAAIGVGVDAMEDFIRGITGGGGMFESQSAVVRI